MSYKDVGADLLCAALRIINNMFIIQYVTQCAGAGGERGTRTLDLGIMSATL